MICVLFRSVLFYFIYLGIFQRSFSYFLLLGSILIPCIRACTWHNLNSFSFIRIYYCKKYLISKCWEIFPLSSFTGSQLDSIVVKHTCTMISTLLNLLGVYCMTKIWLILVCILWVFENNMYSSTVQGSIL